MILPVLLGGGLLWLLASSKKKPVLGAPGSNSTVVKGPESGILYPVTFGEPSQVDGRRVHAVHNPEMLLLFTFVQDGNGQNRSLMARSPDPELADQIDLALRDFGFGTG